MRSLSRFTTSRLKGLGGGGGGPALPRVTLSVAPAVGIKAEDAVGTVVATITSDATSLVLGSTDAARLEINGMSVRTVSPLTGLTSLSFTVTGTKADHASRTISVQVSVAATPVTPDPVTIFTPTGNGYTGENHDHFLETPPVPTTIGYALETA